MTILGPAPAALDRKTLIKRFGQHFKELCQKYIESDIEAQRIVQVATALRNELYWKGKQHLQFTLDPETGGVGLSPISLPIPGSDPKTDSKRIFNFTFNVTRSDGQKFVALTGQRAPHVAVNPKDPNSYDSVQAAKDASAVTVWLRDLLDFDRHQKDVARHMWRTGPVFLRAVWNVDGNKYGWDAKPRFDTEMAPNGPATYTCTSCGATVPESDYEASGGNCPTCSQPIPSWTRRDPEKVPVPKIVGVDRAPKGMPELRIYTVLDVFTPSGVKSIAECIWLACDTDEHKACVVDRYPFLRKKMEEAGTEGDSPAQAAASEARDLVSAESGTIRRDRVNRWRVGERWLQPVMFNLLPRLQAMDVDEQPVSNSDGSPMVIGDQLKEQFPDGVRLVFVEGELVDIVQEKAAEVWAVAKTGEDEKISGAPLCNDLIPIQDAVNSFMNMAMETILRGMPKSLVDSSLIDRNALRNNNGSAYEILPVKVPIGNDIQKLIGQIPAARFSDQLVPLLELFRNYSREIDGIMEAAFGGGPPSPTWRESQQRKNQALMQLYTAHDEMQAGWEQAITNLVKLCSEYGTGVVNPGSASDALGYSGRPVDLSQIRIGGWTVEAEEGIPMSFSEEVDRFFFLLEKPPEVIQALDIFHPVNKSRVQQLAGMRGFYCTGDNERRRALRIIQRLKESAPIPQMGPDGQPQMGPDGQPQYAPSIAPDPVVDDPTQMLPIFKAWLISESGAEAEDQEPEWFANVKAFASSLQQMLPPPPPPEPKFSMAFASTPKDIGPQATQAMLHKLGIDAPVITPPPDHPAPGGPGGHPPLPPGPPGRPAAAAA